MQNRWINALVKTIIFLIAAHVVFLFLGYFIRTDIGIFGLPMWWAHWSDNFLDAGIGIVLSVVIYLIIYAFFSTPKQIED